MKTMAVYACICVFLLILVAGCTSPTTTTPATTTPTAIPATINPTPVPTALSDPALMGTWYLKAMGEQGGTAPVQVINPQITAIFNGQNISGFSGCNNYGGQYILTGQVLPDGKGISIGPLTSTMMYCADTANTETTYLQILQAARSYTVNVNQELTITSNTGSTLIYQRTPYSSTAVPQGI